MLMRRLLSSSFQRTNRRRSSTSNSGRLQSQTQTEMLETLMRAAEPSLCWLLNDKRSPYTDWRQSTAPRPIKVPFEKTLSADSVSVSGSLKPSSDLILDQNVRSFDSRRLYRILCLDGGGARGILTATLLCRIVDQHPDFMNQVDFISGTSVGGMLALMLAAGHTPKECQELLRWGAPHIFGYFPWRIINPFKAKYSDEAKEQIMQEYFGDRTMMDLLKKCAVIAFRLDGRRSKTHSFFNKEGWRPAVFSNMPKASGVVEPDHDLLVWDAAMRTSAAPTYFPVYNGYVDGGIVANNPTALAVAKVIAHYPNLNSRNIVVLSLGTGFYPRHVEIQNHSPSFDKNGIPISACGGTGWMADWGLRQWAPYLLDLLLSGDSVTTEMVMHYLMSHSHLYHRFDIKLPRAIALDDVGALDELVSIGEDIDLTETLKFVDDHFTYQDLEAADHTMVTNTLDQSSDYHDAWVNNYIYRE